MATTAEHQRQQLLRLAEQVGKGNLRIECKSGTGDIQIVVTRQPTKLKRLGPSSSQPTSKKRKREEKQTISKEGSKGPSEESSKSRQGGSQRESREGKNEGEKSKPKTTNSKQDQRATRSVSVDLTNEGSADKRTRHLPVSPPPPPPTHHSRLGPERGHHAINHQREGQPHQRHDVPEQRGWESNQHRGTGAHENRTYNRNQEDHDRQRPYQHRWHNRRRYHQNDPRQQRNEDLKHSYWTSQGKSGMYGLRGEVRFDAYGEKGRNEVRFDVHREQGRNDTYHRHHHCENPPRNLPKPPDPPSQVVSETSLATREAESRNLAAKKNTVGVKVTSHVAKHAPPRKRSTKTQAKSNVKPKATQIKASGKSDPPKKRKETAASLPSKVPKPRAPVLQAIPVVSTDEVAAVRVSEFSSCKSDSGDKFEGILNASKTQSTPQPPSAPQTTTVPLSGVLMLSGMILPSVEPKKTDEIRPKASQTSKKKSLASCTAIYPKTGIVGSKKRISRSSSVATSNGKSSTTSKGNLTNRPKTLSMENSIVASSKTLLATKPKLAAKSSKAKVGVVPKPNSSSKSKPTLSNPPALKSNSTLAPAPKVRPKPSNKPTPKAVRPKNDVEVQSKPALAVKSKHVSMPTIKTKPQITVKPKLAPVIKAKPSFMNKPEPRPKPFISMHVPNLKLSVPTKPTPMSAVKSKPKVVIEPKSSRYEKPDVTKNKSSSVSKHQVPSQSNATAVRTKSIKTNSQAQAKSTLLPMKRSKSTTVTKSSRATPSAVKRLKHQKVIWGKPNKAKVGMKQSKAEAKTLGSKIPESLSSAQDSSGFDDERNPATQPIAPTTSPKRFRPFLPLDPVGVDLGLNDFDLAPDEVMEEVHEYDIRGCRWGNVFDAAAPSESPIAAERKENEIEKHQPYRVKSENDIQSYTSTAPQEVCAIDSFTPNHGLVSNHGPNMVPIKREDPFDASSTDEEPRVSKHLYGIAIKSEPKLPHESNNVLETIDPFKDNPPTLETNSGQFESEMEKDHPCKEVPAPNVTCRPTEEYEYPEMEIEHDAGPVLQDGSMDKSGPDELSVTGVQGTASASMPKIADLPKEHSLYAKSSQANDDEDSNFADTDDCSTSSDDDDDVPLISLRRSKSAVVRKLRAYSIDTSEDIEPMNESEVDEDEGSDFDVISIDSDDDQSTETINPMQPLRFSDASEKDQSENSDGSRMSPIHDRTLKGSTSWDPPGVHINRMYYVEEVLDANIEATHLDPMVSSPIEYSGDSMYGSLGKCSTDKNAKIERKSETAFVIVIDDDDDDNNDNNQGATKKARNCSTPTPKNGISSSGKSQKASLGSNNSKKHLPKHKLPHGYPHYNLEKATLMQDQLLREAANRMQGHTPAFTIRQETSEWSTPKVSFSSVVQDIDKRFPYHWKWTGNHSAILGVPPSASTKTVKKQYHRLALRYHPDKNPSKSSEAKFHAITVAYRSLTS